MIHQPPIVRSLSPGNPFNLPTRPSMTDFEVLEPANPTGNRMRNLCGLVLVWSCLSWTATPLFAQPPQRESRGASGVESSSPVTAPQRSVDRERPRLPLTVDAPELDEVRRKEIDGYVSRHLPGVSRMLRVLERRVPPMFDRAMESLNRDIHRLQTLEKRDAEGFAIALERWKTRNLIDLQVAQIALRPDALRPDELENRRRELSRLVERQEELRRQQLELEIQRTKTRLARMESQLQRAESEAGLITERTTAELLNRARRLKQRAGEKNGGAAASPDRPAIGNQSSEAPVVPEDGKSAGQDQP